MIYKQIYKKAGFATGQVGSEKITHPSERQKLLAEASALKSYDLSHTGNGTESEDGEYKNESTYLSARKNINVKVATNLVTSTRVSTDKAAEISKQLLHDGINI